MQTINFRWKSEILLRGRLLIPMPRFGEGEVVCIVLQNFTHTEANLNYMSPLLISLS